jgi:hypothetical protein
MIITEGSHWFRVEQMWSLLGASGGLRWTPERQARRGDRGRGAVAGQHRTLSRVRRYLMPVTGCGPAQVARPIREHGQTGELKPKPAETEVPDTLSGHGCPGGVSGERL